MRPDSAGDLVRSGDLQGAHSLLSLQESRSPDQPEIKQRLGWVLLQMGEPQRAAKKFESALALRPNDATTLLYLAQAQDASGSFTSALDSYSRYLNAGGRRTKAVRSSIDRLAETVVRSETKSLLLREARLDAVDIPESTLAVPDFRNTQGDESLEPLARGLAAVMITDLRKVGAFRLLEREQLRILQEEMALAHTPNNSGSVVDSIPNSPSDPARIVSFEKGRSTGIVDAATAPRLGLLLRARLFVQGYIAPAGEGHVQLNAALLQTVDGTLLSTGSPLVGPLDQTLVLEKGLVYQTLTTLGVEPTQEERRAIDRPATTSFEAFLFHSRGLYLLDLGRVAEAQASFAAAVALDPGFAEAADKLDPPEEDDRVIDLEGALFADPDAQDPTEIGIDIAVDISGGEMPDDGDGDRRSARDLSSLSPSDAEKAELGKRIVAFPVPPGGTTR